VPVDERAAPIRGASKVPAILDVWYPGTGEAAVANLLFGSAVRREAAVLVDTRCRTGADDLRASDDAGARCCRQAYSTRARRSSLWIRLTTTFADNLKLDRTTAMTGDTVKVSVDVKNHRLARRRRVAQPCQRAARRRVPCGAQGLSA
jgi:hypothetical protein